ncbi:MAG TPA: Ig-like domain-containing protein [Candidatus Acidoferrales bacterium]
MRNTKLRTILILTLLMVGVAGGCGREQAPGASAPTVVSTSPANGAINVLVAATISATFSDAMAPATINATTFTVTGPGTAPIAGTVTYAGGTATFTPTSDLPANTLFTATITTGATDITGGPLASNYSWSFMTGTAPLVISTNPAGGATNVPLAQITTATFNEPMNATTINASTFTLTGTGGAAVNGTVSYAGNTATFAPSAALTAGVTYTATITSGAQDLAGNAVIPSFIWSFTAVPSPTVISTNPGSAATNVPINQKITATFSVPMNAATVIAAGTFTVAVAGTGGAGVSGVVTYVPAANTATFAPAANLLASTMYTAMISTAATSAAGIPLARTYAWSFMTGLTADTTPPTVVLTVPASAAMDVPTNQIISATFSEAMDPATITAPGTFTVAVAGLGGAAVPGTVTYAGSIATFTPSATLTAATSYTATITNAATDLAGNALVAGAVPNPWSFMTGAAPDTTPPTITLTSPASGATGVALNAAINATFSEAMNPASIFAAGTFTLAVAGTGGAAVAGTVTYDPASDIATFTPTANLAANTEYTATITNAVTDLAGNALAAGVAPNPWSFTTGGAAGPVGPPLGTASTFGTIGGGAGITNQGLNTVIDGNIGTTGASTLVTGFHDAGVGCTYTETPLNKGIVNGTIYTAPPPPTVACPSEGTAATFAIATQAASDALTAYNDISPASRPGGMDPGAGQLGGLTLTPGIYKAAGGSFLLTGSDLTLDAQGDVNAIWVFQMASSLTVGGPAAPRNIILINGAQAKNVYWYVGTAATINAAGGGTMVGTIIASAGVTFSTAGNSAVTTLNGRALALNASVTMVNTVINVPAP